MNLALFRKTVRDSRVLILVMPLAIVVFEVLFLRGLVEFISDKTMFEWFERSFARRFTRVLLGADLLEGINLTSLMTLGFAHPLVYALTWSLVLAVGTRVIAGEIDRGTADLLLSLPLSRARIYACVSSVWLMAGIPVSLAPLAGAWLGQRILTMPETLNLERLALLVVNLFALYVAVGGITSLASSLVSRRGPAVAISLTVILASVLLNTVAQFSETIKQISFLGLLDYYRPLPIIRSGQLPIHDILVLLGIGGACWLAGLWRFRRRDIPAA